MKENSFLKEQCEHLEEECRKLRELKVETENKLSNLPLTEQSFDSS